MLANQPPNPGFLMVATPEVSVAAATAWQTYLPTQPQQQTQAMVVAQLEDVDVLGDMVNVWNTFISSGQVWALIIGLVLGYLIRGMTTY